MFTVTATHRAHTTGTRIVWGAAFLGVTVTLVPAGRAQVILAAWTGASGNWTNPALWSTNPNFPNNGNPPGATYDATVNGTGTLTLDASIAVRGLTLQAGTVTGANGLTLSGPLNWSGGTLSGTGPTAADGGLALSGAGTKTLDGQALTVGGSASTWSGTLTMQNGAVLTNAAGSTITGVFSAAGGVGAQPQFVNNGTFQGDVFAYAARLVNNGVVTGTLTTANATLNAGSRVGRLSLDGPVTLAGASQAGSLDWASGSGSVGGNGTLTVAGALSWTGPGGFTGGTTVVNGGGGITSIVPHPVDAGATLALNAGNFGMSGISSSMRVDGTVVIGPGATFTMAAGNGAAVGGAGTLRNFGLIRSVLSPLAVDAFSLGTFINSGTVDVGGRVTSSPMVSVGGTVRGTGRFTGAMTFDATSTMAPGPLSPANAPGILTVAGPVTMTPGAVFQADLNGPTPGTGHDRLDLSGGGSVNLGGASLLTALGYAPSAVDSLTILLGGPVSGTFAGLPDGTEFSVGSFGGAQYVGTISYSPSFVVLSNIHPVPEPAAWLLAGGAAVAWGLRRRLVRRR